MVCSVQYIPLGHSKVGLSDKLLPETSVFEFHHPNLHAGEFASVPDRDRQTGQAKVLQLLWEFKHLCISYKA